MIFLDHLQTYYKGERAEAFILTLSGVMFFVLCYCIWKYAEQNSFEKGLLYPLLFLAIIGFFIGGFNTINNSKRLQNMPVEYRADSKAFIEKETARMQGVNSWWLPLKITWSVLLIVGIVMTYTLEKETMLGLALGLIIIGTVGHIIDGIAHNRANIYTARLLENTIL